MNLVRGGVYLARLDPVKGSEIGKLRPVVILIDTGLVLPEIIPTAFFFTPSCLAKNLSRH